MSGLKTDDCYFYYNSMCSKGFGCPYRHEPSARGTETVCYYWKTGGCTRPHCSFRHMEPTATERRAKQCFWELQPSGCQKVQCPFSHVKSRLSLVEMLKPVESGSIIVNKRKLESLQHIIPVQLVALDPPIDNKPRRLMVPPGTGEIARRAVTGGIKNRLGKLGDIKKRLGSKGEVGLDESQESSPDVDSIEEVELRESAIKSIDLRNRLFTKKPVESSNLDEEYQDVLRQIQKSKKELEERKENKKISDGTKTKKKKKKLKKKEIEEEESDSDLPPDKSVVSSRIFQARRDFDLPSASDYSDLDTPNGSPDPELITVMSKTTGMYADTKAFNRSARVRLGKRKSDGSADVASRSEAKKPRSYAARVLGQWKEANKDVSLVPEVHMKPRRVQELLYRGRNPSPPPPSEKDELRSPSPPPSPPSSPPSPTLSPSRVKPAKDIMEANFESSINEEMSPKNLKKKKKKEKEKKMKKSKKEEKKYKKKLKKGSKSEKTIHKNKNVPGTADSEDGPDNGVLEEKEEKANTKKNKNEMKKDALDDVVEDVAVHPIDEHDALLKEMEELVK